MINFTVTELKIGVKSSEFLLNQLQSAQMTKNLAIIVIYFFNCKNLIEFIFVPGE